MKCKYLVKFKSSPSFYEKEKSGLKNNTVRELNIDDVRLHHLLHYAHEGFKLGELEIKIVNSLYEDMFFMRTIKDISFYNHLLIITWKEEQG